MRILGLGCLSTRRRRCSPNSERRKVVIVAQQTLADPLRELDTSVSDRRALVLSRVGHEMQEEGASHDQGNGRYNPNDDQYLTFPNDFVRNTWLKVP